MSGDIVERLRNHSKRPVGCDCVRCEAAVEIGRLLAEVRGFQAESGCWQRWHDAEWALADQLADAVQGLRQAAIIGVYRPSEELAAAHAALAAHAAARTNGSASATDVGGPS